MAIENIVSKGGTAKIDLIGPATKSKCFYLSKNGGISGKIAASGFNAELTEANMLWHEIMT
jgi:hypothetical protein